MCSEWFEMDFEHLKSTISFFRKKILTDEIDEIILSPSEVRTDDIDEIIWSPSKVHKIFRIQARYIERDQLP